MSNLNKTDSERITRTEEQLIAERSARKTRDDQLYEIISDIRRDMKDQDSSLSTISLDVKDIATTVARMEEMLSSQKIVTMGLQMQTQENREAITSSRGFLKALVFIAPIIGALIGLLSTFFIENTHLKASTPPASHVEAHEEPGKWIKE